jgi:predicted O-methyltransferase YrrM
MNPEHWKTVFGWFDFMKVYDTAIDAMRDGDIAVELGTFLGKSTCYFAQRMKDTNKKITFYACDIFEAPEVPSIPKEYWGDFFTTFIKNLKAQGVEEIVIPVCMDSLEFPSSFDDGTVSFIYIDDNHDVSHVYQELVAWYPKLKKGGTLSGHDFNAVKDAVIKFTNERGLSYFTTGGSWTLKEKN